MGSKLAWTGMFFLLGSAALGMPGVFELVGAIFLAIGVVLMWLNI